MEETPVTLVSIGGGAAVELFERELQAVLKSIADVNTDPEALRTITVTVKIKPTPERSMGQVLIDAKSKVPGASPHTTTIYMGRVKTGELVAVESNPKQLSFDKPPAEVTPFSGRRP
jgi:hypothetical protein